MLDGEHRTFRILEGDALEQLRALPAESVRCCVTSPPYYGLRDYGHDGQIGLEPSPAEFLQALADVFDEVRRVLTPDGTLWLNIGDSYVGAWGRQGQEGLSPSVISARQIAASPRIKSGAGRVPPNDWGLRRKSMMGLPWRLAFALQERGWILRQDNIWEKPNARPESVKDRGSGSHEYVFHFSKRASYFYDWDATVEPFVSEDQVFREDAKEQSFGAPEGVSPHTGLRKTKQRTAAGRNRRSVWSINTYPNPDAHFATFPPALAKHCIVAGSAIGDTVLDPFTGSGTTGLVALRLGLHFVGVELNPKYAEMARRRIYNDAPMFNREEKT